MRIPSMGRVTGKVFNPLLNVYEPICYEVGLPRTSRFDRKHSINMLLMSSPSKNPKPALRKYDPLVDSYNEYIEQNGSYPIHFNEVTK